MDEDFDDIIKMIEEDVEIPKKIITIKPKETPKEELAISDHDMSKYYTYLFPYELYFKWFGAGDSSYFEKREFSFTKRGDIYIRFLSFRDDKELRTEVLKANPIKIDIGAVYNTLPRYRASSGQNFIPVQKELVFDIDMTDYDDVRTCCSDAKICNKCWKYMIVAYKILNAALTEDFGFENIMWVFSGRRGIHCWIGDDRARKLTNEGRASIANYLSWKKITKNSGLSSQLRKPLHPSHIRAINIIESCFEEYVLIGQDILNDKKIIDLVSMIVKAYFESKKDFNIYESEFKKIINSNLSSVEKWKNIKKSLEDYSNKEKLDPFQKALLCIYDIEMAIMYPRLDINVSKHINHLLKSPFCVHPKTGLISVPLDEESIMNFDLNIIPNLKDSLSDYEQKKRSKFEKYIEIFDKLSKK